MRSHLLALIVLSQSCPFFSVGGAPFEPPPTRKDPVLERLHGLPIADPFRWLEDSNSEDVKDWVQAQNEFTQSHLATLSRREPLRQRLTELWNYPRVGIPTERVGRLFHTRNSGLQNQSVLLWRESADTPSKTLLDPNLLSTNGTTSLATFVPSDDARFVAWATSQGGSDWREVRIREVATGADLPETLRWVKFSSMTWTPDGAGFFYKRYPEPPGGDLLQAVNHSPTLHYHRLRTDQSSDKLIYHRPDDKNLGFSETVTDDGEYLVLTGYKGTDRRTTVHWARLRDALAGDAQFKPLFDQMDAAYNFLGNQGEQFFFATDNAAPRQRVIRVDLNHPEPSRWTTIVPEAEATLDSTAILNNQLWLVYMKDATHQVAIRSLEGADLGQLPLPGLGTVSGFGGRQNATSTYFSFGGFLSPNVVYRLNLNDRSTSVFEPPSLKFDPGLFITTQVFYQSKDGTRIPMFLTHRRDLKRDGNTPTLLYGYGGFDISILPSFAPNWLAWIEMGGVYASACLRGGGEYGKEWHMAGTKLNKQNVFDDFIAAAEHLVAEKYTNPSKLAIHGRSNGGLLVGACMAQRPELFGVALPGVGVMDMLRFHKFTIGWAWTSDYGSPDDPAEFEALLKYSPIHNLRFGRAYPATLITTADHDDRVVPAHSYKFAAALQAAQAGPAPAMIRIDTKAGHGAGKSTAMVIEEWADILAFTAHHLGLQPPSAAPAR